MTTVIGSSAAVFGFSTLLKLDEQREIGFARLLEHEVAQRRRAELKRLASR